MNSTITIDATLQADGLTLNLANKLPLPPGPVTVTVRSAISSTGPTMLEVLDRIHDAQAQRGCKAPTEEEMAAEIARLRAEDSDYDERWRQIWSQSSGDKAKP